MKKKSFLLYHEYYIHFKYLTIEQKGTLLDAIFEYEINKKETQLEPIVEMAFSFVKADLDINMRKYEETCKRNRDNGSKGGRPSNKQEPKKPSGLSGIIEKPKKPDNGNEKENEKIEIYDNDFKTNKLSAFESWNWKEDKTFIKWCKAFKEKNPSFNGFNESFIEEKIEELCDYCRSKGKSYKDYQSALKNWIRNEAKNCHT